jgi:hypothetical protein
MKHFNIEDDEKEPEMDMANPPKDYMDKAHAIAPVDPDAMEVDTTQPEVTLSEAEKEAELEKIEGNLADPQTYADTKLSAELLSQHTALKDKLDSAMQNWEALLIQIELL